MSNFRGENKGDSISGKLVCVFVYDKILRSRKVSNNGRHKYYFSDAYATVTIPLGEDIPEKLLGDLEPAPIKL